MKNGRKSLCRRICNTYDGFGNLTASTGSDGNPYRYTAREYDPETGLYYYRARYYDPQIGRFLNEDPIRFAGGIHLYTYAVNAPVQFVDPGGTSISSVHTEETLKAALAAGFSYSDAKRLAFDVADVDFRPGSQKTNPGATHMHAMGGLKSKDDWETCQGAYAGSIAELKAYMISGDVAGALHEIEDSYSSSHRYRPWHGGLPGPSHLAGDVVYHLGAQDAADLLP